MEQQKIRGEAKSLTLDNGIELTYCERGERNDEVIVAEHSSFIHSCRSSKSSRRNITSSE